MMTLRNYFIILITALLPGILNAAEDLSSQPTVKTFIKEMSHKHHFDQKKLSLLFDQVHLRPTVMQNIQQPLEKKPWYLYRLLFVTNQRVQHGVQFWKKNQDALNAAYRKYGVPPSIIVATIGIETKYGKDVGHYRVIDALSSVAFSKSPRAPFFRRELEEYLLLAREKHFDPLISKGSYAGAMGLPQFMPDSYRRYAVSYSGHSQPDLYLNEADVITSVANYYHAHGWVRHQPIATPTVSLGLQKKIPENEKEAYGRTLTLENYFTREYWKTYHNFDVIKKYNTSDLYAMAVYHLSEKITLKKKKADAI